MLEEYRQHQAARAAEGLVAKPLNAGQVQKLTELLQHPPVGEEAFLYDLFVNRVPPGVDDAARVKADYLAALAAGDLVSPLIDKIRAIALLGTMLGGYNIPALIAALDNPELAPAAADALSYTLLIFDNFQLVEAKAAAGNLSAQQVLRAWADAEWFLKRPAVGEKITVSVFKVPGETNTDDLSPAQDVWSRPDIPLHALSMLKNPHDGIEADQPGVIGPLSKIAQLKEQGFPLVFVGETVGTGSSRKSAANSLLWHMGEDIPFVPNKRGGGMVIGGKIAPIFFNTLEDSGALPIEADVSQLNMGDVIDVYPYKGEIRRHDDNKLLTTFTLKTDMLLDEVRAGGRIPLIIGRALVIRARQALSLPPDTIFRQANAPAESSRGFSLAQKIVGRACGVAGIRPGTYCEPKITSIGSPDTSGPMTRDELKDLACLRFSADLVMQSFCHTAAYPKQIDVQTHQTLADFMRERGGISLRPGDGVIHSWLNRMVLPDTVGTGGDSHTRFPIGLSLPAGSGLVAFAAATGIMPLDMPESVRVRFHGTMRPGITLRDLVHAIPYYASKQGLLTVGKKDKVNIFSGRILEIEGLEALTVEQAFELTAATAERSAAGCTIKLNSASIIDSIKGNVVLLKSLIAEGYGDRDALERRILAMEEWLVDPQLLEADADADYTATIDIYLNDINEPLLCAPNDPDDVRPLSAVANHPVNEVFIGSCMTNIGHFRAVGEVLNAHEGQLPVRLWLAPPTRMDASKLKDEGWFSIFGQRGARIEIPGCSLCMGNQARVADGTTVVATSTRNFPNRLGAGARVYLASAELAAVAARLGKLPTPETYLSLVKQIDERVYHYLQFDRLDNYMEKAAEVIFQTRC
ncbi:TPA: bifunctional aconitate hydratase 2/2-methylisocitrate dehydratase [Klebsiella oxytoca]|nr:bifunctional aconitate hydratase 2/2-methylisocitrate dehydratase [Klebsiella oxytoca]